MSERTGEEIVAVEHIVPPERWKCGAQWRFDREEVDRCTLEVFVACNRCHSLTVTLGQMSSSPHSYHCLIYASLSCNVCTQGRTRSVSKWSQQKAYLNGRDPECIDERIMPMFNDIEWTKIGNTETCLHNAKEVAAFATQSKPGHWCFLEHASENTWWNGNLNKPTDNKLDSVASHMVEIFKCHIAHPIFPATEPLSLGHLRKGGGKFHFQGTNENKQILMKTTLAGNLRCIYNRISH